MVFSSVIFLCMFLPAVLLGYYILPKRARGIWLLAASLGFYACGGPRHLIYLVSSVVFNYLAGIIIAHLCDDTHPADERGQVTFHPVVQKIALVAAVIINIGSLVYFKYSKLLVETYNGLFGKDSVIPDIILPLGISFYTFQCLSYVIDVYRTEGAILPDGSKNTLYTANIVKFALYITMFAQLLQGPIIRFSEVKDSLECNKAGADGFVRGIERFITGLAKKAVIANTIGEVSDRIFEMDIAGMSASVAWLGAILFTLQIYFDFAGYTDMAIGIGKMFGFDFAENFNYPYISQSITEFWRRWHITLGSWFRDYLYIPLGGNRKGNVYVNLLTVFLATGIWHGAAWGFLVWGLWHGIFMLIERALKGRDIPLRIPKTVAAVLKWGYTMLAVSLGWVLFKIEDIAQALSYIRVMFGLDRHAYNAFSVRFFLDARMIFFLIIAVLACIPWAQILPRFLSSRIAEFAESNRSVPRIARHACLIGLLVISYIFIVNTTYSPFIYFQF